MESNCKEIEITIIDLFTLKLFLFCIYYTYVPPGLLREQLIDAENFIILSSDQLFANKLDHRLIVAGDMNSLNTKDLCDKLCLADLVNKPTRQDNILDHILV